MKQNIKSTQVLNLRQVSLSRIGSLVIARTLAGFGFATPDCTPPTDDKRLLVVDTKARTFTFRETLPLVNGADMAEYIPTDNNANPAREFLAQVHDSTLVEKDIQGHKVLVCAQGEVHSIDGHEVNPSATIGRKPSKGSGLESLLILAALGVALGEDLPTNATGNPLGSSAKRTGQA